MSWKQRFTYRSKHYVERKINGNNMRFYPNRVGLLEELGEVSKPLAQAFNTLFADTRGDNTAVTERFREGKDTEVEKITVEAVSPEVATFRAKEKAQAIDTLVTGLTNTRTRILLGRLLMDSLREEFPFSRDRSAGEVEEFLDGDGEEYEGIDLPTLAELIRGWAEANTKVFGSVGEKVAGLVDARLRSLRVESTPETQETSPASGPDSKTPSSSPSDSASTSDS